MKLYLLRHGQTIGNINKIYSDLQTPLSSLGQRQIFKAGQKLINEEIDEIWVSPAKRTLQSLKIVNSLLHRPYKIERDLVEIDPGKMAGLSWDEGMKIYPDQLRAYLDDFVNVPLPGGESIKDAYRRAGLVLDKARQAEKNILLVGHGGLISLMLSHIGGSIDKYYEFSPQNASLSLVELGDEDRIIYFNKV